MCFNKEQSYIYVDYKLPKLFWDYFAELFHKAYFLLLFVIYSAEFSTAALKREVGGWREQAHLGIEITFLAVSRVVAAISPNKNVSHSTSSLLPRLPKLPGPFE